MSQAMCVADRFIPRWRTYRSMIAMIATPQQQLIDNVNNRLIDKNRWPEAHGMV